MKTIMFTIMYQNLRNIVYLYTTVLQLNLYIKCFNHLHNTASYLGINVTIV